MAVLRADRVAAALRRGGPATVDADVPARFAPGDAVVVRNAHPPGHTRAPRYVRGRVGTVVRDHGVMVFPDAHAHGLGKRPQHCWSVRFEARELWGDEAPARDAVHVDLWDDHLDPA